MKPRTQTQTLELVRLHVNCARAELLRAKLYTDIDFRIAVALDVALNAVRKTEAEIIDAIKEVS
jgi:hypothetical protein